MRYMLYHVNVNGYELLNKKIQHIYEQIPEYYIFSKNKWSLRKSGKQIDNNMRLLESDIQWEHTMNDPVLNYSPTNLRSLSKC